MNIRSIIGNTLSKLYIRTEELAFANVLQKVFDYFTKVSAVFTGTVDFTNATVTGASSYKVYSALLSQSGLDSAPTAVVLENTLGDIVFTYQDAGRYSIIFDTGEFTILKTSININYVNTSGDGEFRAFVMCGREDDQTLRLRTYDASLTLGNSLLSNHFIEIRVYN